MKNDNKKIGTLDNIRKISLSLGNIFSILGIILSIIGIACSLIADDIDSKSRINVIILLCLSLLFLAMILYNNKNRKNQVVLCQDFGQ